MQNLGASVFPTTAGTDILSGVTTGITDNIGVALTVVAGMVALRIGFKLFNNALKGKARI